MANNREERVVTIIANAKPATASINQLQRAVQALNAERNKEKAGSDRYRQLTADLSQMNARLTTARNEVRNLDSASSKFWTNFKTMAAGVVGGNLITAAITSIGNVFASAVKHQADLSDQYADIRKTTGLTIEQVEELDGKLGDIDTRTGRKELRELAVAAGELGKTGVEDIQKFVEEGNMINVALSDLGEGAVRDIGRLADLFDMSMSEIGGAINEIGAQSSATAPYQVDFLNRIAGTGKQAGLSAAQLLGYSSTLEQLAISSEVGATALNQFFLKFIGDFEKFGKIAGMQKGQLKDIFDNQGTDAAFKAFLTSLNGNVKGTEAFIKSLDEMGLEGAKSSAVFLSLAQNSDKLTAQQKIAGDAIKENTSLTNEYNIKNKNFAAELEKLGKKIKGFVMNNPLTNFFINLVKWSVRNFDALVSLGKVVVLGAVIWGTYKAVVGATILWQKIMNVEIGKSGAFLTLQRLALIAASFAQGIFTGNMMLASTAMAAFNKLVKLNPFGVIVTAVTAAIVAFKLFNPELSEAERKQKTLNDVMAEADANIVSQKNELNQLLAVAREETLSKEKREEAIKRLNEISPEYLGNLTLETINTDAAKISIDAYNKSLLEESRIKAIKARIDENSKKILDEEIRLSKEKAGIFGFRRNEEGDKNLKLMKEENKLLNDQLLTSAKLAETPGFYGSKFGGNNKKNKNTSKTPKTKAEKLAEPEKLADKLKALKEIEIENYKKAEDMMAEYTADKNQRMAEDELQRLTDSAWATYRKEEKEINDLKVNDATKQKLLEEALLKKKQTIDNFIKENPEFDTVDSPEISASDRLRENILNEINKTIGTDAERQQMKDKFKQELEDLREHKRNIKNLQINAAKQLAGDLENLAFAQMAAHYDKQYSDELAQLEKKREAELSNKKLTEEQKADINKLYDDKRREILNRQAKTEKNLALFRIAVDTSVAAVSALKTDPSGVLSALIVAQGLAQAAMVNAREVPQFMYGGKTPVRGADDGKYYNATNVGSISSGGVYSRPSLGLLGEKGAELVIPNYLYTAPRMANTMAALENMISTRQFANGGNTSSTPVPQFNTSDNTEAVAALNANTIVMGQMIALLNDGIVAKTYYDKTEYDKHKKRIDDTQRISRL